MGRGATWTEPLRMSKRQSGEERREDIPARKSNRSEGWGIETTWWKWGILSIYGLELLEQKSMKREVVGEQQPAFTDFCLPH